MVSLWGKVQAVRCRYRCRGCQRSQSCWLDGSLDESGLLPEVLARVHELGVELPYRRAGKLLSRWGVELSKSELARLNESLNEVTRTQGEARLLALAQRPLMSPGQTGKRWVVEIDGTFVATYLPQEKRLEWREVKSAVLYPMHSPSQRYFLSDLSPVEVFAAQLHGLLRQAGVTQEDELIGISDGALWIAILMGDLGVSRHILDVYHASSYFERLMLALTWDEAQRRKARRRLLEGRIDLQAWLNRYVKNELALSEDGQEALAYLHKQALLDHTCYPTFKAQGIEVIGSGQIEGANKFVIGGRLKLSGAHWSEAGARDMAFTRAQSYSRQPLNTFHRLRHLAFPQAA